MPRDVVRTTVDIPAPIYRRLKEQAARKGCSVRDLIMSGAEHVLLRPQRPPKRRVRFPLIESRGPKVALTNERIYELVEFP